MKNSEEQAFPSVSFNSDGLIVNESNGLTKREYFAGLAMQGILSNISQEPTNKYSVNDGFLNTELIAKDSIKCADELLKQLESK